MPVMSAAPSPSNSDVIIKFHARVNGWAQWRTLEYADPAEEAAFVAKDFQSMLNVHLGIFW